MHQPAAHVRRPWTVLVLLCVAQFMVILDITVVNVALPTIGTALDFARDDLQWVVTAYVLCTGGLLLLGGRAADRLGRRRTFLAGLSLFTAASLASGLAPSPEALIAARTAQGIAAAFLTPAALSIIVTTYTGAQHTTALTVWAAIGSAGAAAGVLLGGMLTSWLSWEWIFLINVPVGAVAALLALRVLPGDVRGAGGRGLDLPGAVAVMGGLALLVYGLDQTGEHGWTSARTLLLFAGAAALLALFAAVERAAARPLVPPATWRQRPLVAGAALMFGATGIMLGTFFLNTIYLQEVIGASPIETGLAFLPLVGAIGLSAHAAAQLAPRAGTRSLAVAGMAIIAAAALFLAVAPDRASYAADLLPGLFALGLGVGLVFPSANMTAMSEIDGHQAGLASGLLTTAHEVGGALGVAVLSAVAAGGAFAVGYEEAFLVAAGIAAALAVAALPGVPAVRPAGGVRAALH